MGCLPGETIEQISIGYRSSEFPLRLSHMSQLVLDCLCRYRGTTLTAAKIDEIMRTDPYYRAQRIKGRGHTGLPYQAAVKVYIKRIREHMATIFRENALPFNPFTVLSSDVTESNVIAYRLKASVELAHHVF